MMFKTRPNFQAFKRNQRTVIVVAPILPGKTEAWRRFIQEMWGARYQDYIASRRRLGIQVERAWISETQQWAIGLIAIEADQMEQTLTALASSEHPFDCWFREQLLALQGLDLTRAGLALLPDLVFAWRDAEV
jgi:hypothetical protein